MFGGVDEVQSEDDEILDVWGNNSGHGPEDLQNVMGLSGVALMPSPCSERADIGARSRAS